MSQNTENTISKLTDEVRAATIAEVKAAFASNNATLEAAFVSMSDKMNDINKMMNSQLAVFE